MGDEKLVGTEEASPFVPDQNETVIKVDDFKSFLEHFRKKYVSSWRWLNCRIGRHQHSLLFQCNLPGVELFSKMEWLQFEEVRRKYKHNRTILTDGVHILVKEMPSPIHSRISVTLQSILSKSICRHLLPQDGREEYEKVVSCGDGSKQSFCLFIWTDVRIELGEVHGWARWGISMVWGSCSIHCLGDRIFRLWYEDPQSCTALDYSRPWTSLFHLFSNAHL